MESLVPAEAAYKKAKAEAAAAKAKEKPELVGAH
jgi:hypothetical protein